MPSIIALRAILGASIALGTVDVLWLDYELAPRAVGDDPPERLAAPVAAVVSAPRVPAEVAPAPALAPAPAPVEPSPEEPAAAAPPLAERVYFATRSTALDAAARATLDELAANPGTFVLEGHADIRGRERINAALSRDRALAVEAYLIEHGVDDARIEVGYVGEDDAMAHGALWRDRRVEIQITGGPR